MSKKPIIDSNITLEQALEDNPAKPPCPPEIKDRQRLVTVEYFSFDKKLHQGQILIDIDLVKDVEDAFELIKELKFPIARVVPVAAPKYLWNSKKLVTKGNATNGFCYRFIAGSKRISLHGQGRAIDFNPLQNPHIRYENNEPIVWPHKGWNPAEPGTLHAQHPIVEFFISRGWEWGGNWTHESGRTDYMHFDKAA